MMLPLAVYRLQSQNDLSFLKAAPFTRQVKPISAMGVGLGGVTKAIVSSPIVKYQHFKIRLVKSVLANILKLTLFGVTWHPWLI
jgi:hypothetical protein